MPTCESDNSVERTLFGVPAHDAHYKSVEPANGYHICGIGSRRLWV
jgi:hypothetical protein